MVHCVLEHGELTLSSNGQMSGVGEGVGATGGTTTNKQPRSAGKVWQNASISWRHSMDCFPNTEHLLSRAQGVFVLCSKGHLT